MPIGRPLTPQVGRAPLLPRPLHADEILASVAGYCQRIFDSGHSHQLGVSRDRPLDLDRLFHKRFWRIVAPVSAAHAGMSGRLGPQLQRMFTSVALGSSPGHNRRWRMDSPPK